MIDTINIRLNNASKYPLTCTKYEATTRTGQTTFSADEDTGEIFSSRKIRHILHHDSDNIIPLTKRSKLFLPSSTYAVVYLYNIASDFISFEFSVPKYIWGTNIIQFIRYFNNDLDADYSYFMGFIRRFFQKNTPDVIDMRDVEITRLDMCYNQFFNSKQDALEYLEEQKGLLRTFARNGRTPIYDSSLMYVTGKYSFKIYHKGTEFYNNDRKELFKKNPTGHTIHELQGIADRILRYEVTFRKPMLDKFYNDNELYKYHLGFFKNEASRKSLRLTNKRLYDQTVEFVRLSKHFVFGEVKSFDMVRTSDVEFNKLLFCACYNFFWDYVKKFQLTKMVGRSELGRKIDINNFKVENMSKETRLKLGMNKAMLLMIYDKLQTETFESIKNSGIFPESTFYRYKNQLAKLGITATNTSIVVVSPPIDYLEYKANFGRHHMI